jgi:hypothetical protein
VLSKRRRVEARLQQRARVIPACCPGLAEQGYRRRGRPGPSSGCAVAPAVPDLLGNSHRSSLLDGWSMRENEFYNFERTTLASLQTI